MQFSSNRSEKQLKLVSQRTKTSLIWKFYLASGEKAATNKTLFNLDKYEKKIIESYEK